MKILEAIEITGCDFEDIDIEVLVGALVTIKRWNENYNKIKSDGKKSYLDIFREEGLKIISEYNLK
ncbi:TPA: hypothetical protein ACIX5Y_005265 [Escherichia coli]|uniref:Phage protein n=1 Tax=Escherichia coli TaxID=562 RepID=A0A8S7K4F9_ECOLX|nr:hypothetical protein [Escherichia coli]EFN7272377.1 hypothetical protein [Escherichia coli O21]EEQ2084717.1 hypothetical protein [Escherichia coli]EET9943582.1 hypothetical protein [Escherichia coli]EEV3815990.1 hypothetical protein [Escherichia coli]EEV9625536.1 hypothetical protein [Escherichia coli]